MSVALTTLFDAARRLGLRNCMRLAGYKLRARTGVYRRASSVMKLPHIGSLLLDSVPAPLEASVRDVSALETKAQRITGGELEFFGYAWWPMGSPPRWHENPWIRRTWTSNDTHWSEAREFAEEGFDIKTVWESSRWEWAVLLARAYATSRDERYLRTLCSWLNDWSYKNPLNTAPNWKCGQETSIRLLRFLEVLSFLRIPENANEGVGDFVHAHLRRIELTLSYAIAQDNNHGTSEAAALFIGGQWLLRFAGSRFESRAQLFAARGGSQLVERVVRLVAEDGTFSQYSVNYQRMFLDTLALVECWSRRLGCASPLDSCRTQVEAALQWLICFVDPLSGDAPNLGGNDGALLLISPATGFRDYRPTVQLCSCLFRGVRQYGPGAWDDASRYWWLEPEDFPHDPAKRSSRLFHAGFALLADETERCWAVLRLPTFRFRPPQADALHLDVWFAGENVIRDAGTYSYNADTSTYEYFTGTRGHSTAEIDGRNQMPRIGRFLFARWLKPTYLAFVDAPEPSVSAEYRDAYGARHRRSVRLLKNRSWLVEDELSGIQDEAVIRWHLAPGNFTVFERGVSSDRLRIEVSSSARLRIALETQWESRRYMEKTDAPVLEIRAGDPHVKLSTLISLSC